MPAALHSAPSDADTRPTYPTLGHTAGRAAARKGWTALFRRPMAALLALVTAVVAAYAPSLNGQFLWDDTTLVLHNLFIRSPVFCVEAFRHTLFNGDSNFYRPTQTLVFIADYWCWAFNPFGFHLTSILIHAANACLLFLVLRRILPVLLGDAGRAAVAPEALAFGVALVWAVHPVHSAAVAYVSGSADSLAMLSCLTAWLACERAVASSGPFPRVGWSVAAGAALLLGLCSKEIAFVWMLIFAGWLFGLRRGETSRRARWTVAAAALGVLLAYAGLRHLPPAPPVPPPIPPLPARGVLMLRALGDYGGLMLFPDKLFMERQVFAAPGLANPEDQGVYLALACSGMGMLAAFAAGVCWPGRGRNLRRFGAGWFMVGFLPVSNLFSLNATVAEHWLYLPSIGFLLFLAGVALDLPFTLPRRRAAALAAGVVLLAAVTLGVRTWYRTFDWSDEITFFRQTIADGGDVPRARAGLAAAYSRQHDDARALAVLREIVEKYPHVLSNHINLANVLARQGRTVEAKAALDHVADDLLAHGGDPREVVATIHSLDRLEPGDPAWTARRTALVSEAIRRHPDSWEVVGTLVQDRENAGDPGFALATAQLFARLHWWHAASWLTVGRLDAELGHTADALLAWQHAARLDVYDAEAPSAAAMLCLQQNRLDEARAFQSRAVSRQPDSPKQHALFAEILTRRGETAAAAAQAAAVHALVEQAGVTTENHG